MAAESSSYKKDRQFIVELFKDIIAPEDLQYQYLVLKRF